MSRVHDAMKRAGVTPTIGAASDVVALEAPPSRSVVPAGQPADQVVESPAGEFSTGSTILDPNVDTVVVDEFRKLAAAVHQAQLAQELVALSVASGTPDEGKSMTALNLALTLASSYSRQVLLIDCDLRAPSLAEMMQLPPGPGLTDLLAMPEGSNWPLHQVTAGLAVLTAGRRTRDPISRISSLRMKQVLTEARARYQSVILDTPPIGPLPDATLLSTMTDATVLVVRAGTVSYKVAQRAVEAIGEEKILGVVLNRAPWSAFAETYGYYGHYGDAAGRQ